MVKRNDNNKLSLSTTVQVSSHSKERVTVRENQITLAQYRLTRTAVFLTIFFCFAIGYVVRM